MTHAIDTAITHNSLQLRNERDIFLPRIHGPRLRRGGEVRILGGYSVATGKQQLGYIEPTVSKPPEWL